MKNKRVWKEVIQQVRMEKENVWRKDSMLLDTTRAGKLLRKGKPFIVVACDEPYYLQTYCVIRQCEKAKERWSPYDEECFQKAVKWWTDQNRSVQ